ncbi:MAG TPA: mycofactocin-coupled SDR family oxidoreductase [Acidimicrobiales bacterium]|nr:mycofactocin-coupled SDR family oxidoreductase [Acidimicrobiales bacterium]
MGSLDGQVALITGAARGQGRSHAVALAVEGAEIVACDVPTSMSAPTYPLATVDDLNLTAKLVENQGRRCLTVALDVRDAGAVNAAVGQTIEEFGRLDIVVANAGIVVTGPLAEVSDEAWEELVSTNLTGTFHTLRAAIPAMRKRRYGRIVVTSSMGGRMGIPDLAAYNATKWGVIGLAKSVALEVAKEGITVNVVCPTTTQTPMVQPDPDADIPDELVKRFLRTNPIPTPWLQPEDVTRAVLYLVSDPGVITGSVLEIGLGSSARMH